MYLYIYIYVRVCTQGSCCVEANHPPHYKPGKQKQIYRLKITITCVNRLFIRTLFLSMGTITYIQKTVATEMQR